MQLAVWGAKAGDAPSMTNRRKFYFRTLALTPEPPPGFPPLCPTYTFPFPPPPALLG